MQHKNIKRIVKMTFREDQTEAFEQIYLEKQPFIRNFDGCFGVELLRCKSPENVFFTYSLWKDEQSLERYRQSDLFKGTWALVKPLFEVRAEAWTVEEVGDQIRT
jgi:autoinducer 2-degrading protein